MRIQSRLCAQNVRRVCVMILALSSSIGSVATIATADTFLVTNTNNAGAGSLRDAISQANLNAGADQIDFQAGLAGTIVLADDLPNINEDVTINGPGPRVISIIGNNALRCMAVNSSATIIGLRLANGFTDRGAGIAFTAPAGKLTVNDCHFDQNLATADGGAICVFAGSFELNRCTFTTDQAAGNGGVIWYGQGGGTPTASITNCTFVNNFASFNGGAVRQSNATDYTTSITNCTFVVNNAGAFGGAIAVAGGTMTIQNSLFTANAAGGNPGGHVGTTAGTTTSLGHNLFGHLDGSNIVPDPTDKFGTVPAQLNTGILIAFPFNNGGLTDTLPPVNNTSILIDGGGAAGAPVTDQRGFPRVGCAPDVGAFEVQTPSDSDGDGVLNCLDLCPNTPSCASVNETGCPTDGDADGVFDGCDLCPDTSAGDPIDADGCSTADEDGDGVLNDQDLCRGTPACAVASVDAGGCPQDADGDGLFDGCDQCPGSDDLLDGDADNVPDCLDGCPADPLKLDPGICGCGVAEVDADGDGVIDCVDMCLGTPACAAVDETGCSIDSDADGVADGCDTCPGTFAGDPVDANGCSTADEDGDGVLNDADQCRGTPDCAIAGVDAVGCPTDADADGLFDGCDLCPGSNDLTDTDADGIPDCLDDCPAVGDSDADGVQDCKDGCPADPLKLDPGICGCGAPEVDADHDGVIDCVDLCLGTPACAVVNESGCSIDSDGDGVADGCDTCPGTLAVDPVSANGCSTADEDGDGVKNDADHCRGTPACAKANVGADGCPADADGDGLFDGCDQCPGSDDLTDADADGIPDCLDACPNAGDSDGDGVQDCQDGCPADPLKISPGTCGCGKVDADADGDGIPDCITLPEPAPAPTPTPTDPSIQPFIALGPIFPGGVVCGVGLAGPMALMAAYLFVSGTVRRERRRKSKH